MFFLFKFDVSLREYAPHVIESVENTIHIILVCLGSNLNAKIYNALSLIIIYLLRLAFLLQIFYLASLVLFFTVFLSDRALLSIKGIELALFEIKTLKQPPDREVQATLSHTAVFVVFDSFQ